MRVLVVEDDRETAQFLQKALKESGHAADLAEDGETGLSLARKAPSTTCSSSTACCRASTASR